MRYIRTGSLKRLFSLKRNSFEEEIATPRSSDFTAEDTYRTNTDSSTALAVSHPRPTWKCFSYQEIFDATNGFNPGFYPIPSPLKFQENPTFFTLSFLTFFFSLGDFIRKYGWQRRVCRGLQRDARRWAGNCCEIADKGGK